MRMTHDWNQYGATRLISRNRLRLPHHRLFLEFFVDYFSKISIDACCLDIGCAEGHFLEILRMLGFNNLSGIDPSEHFVERAKVKGLKVKIGNVYELNKDERKYDIILLLDVLEHLECPLQALNNIRRILENSGILFINVPVCDSFFRRSERMFHGKTKLQQMVDWDETHLREYSSDDLKALCMKAGFTPTVSTHISNPFPLVNRVSLKMAISLQRLSFGGRFGDFCSIICRKSQNHRNIPIQ